MLGTKEVKQMEDRDKTKEQLIGELENMRRTVKYQEERLKELQALTTTSQWHVDLQTGEISWCDQDFIILGYKPQEVEPSWELVLEHLHPDDLSTIQSGREQLFDEDFTEAEYRIIRKSGEVRHIYSRNVIEYDSDNDPTIYRGIFQDITERKLKEQEIESLKKELNK